MSLRKTLFKKIIKNRNSTAANIWKIFGVNCLLGLQLILMKNMVIISKNSTFMFCIRKVPTMQPPGHFLKKKKKISNGHRALWPKALLENQKMWVANYFKYPQQVKLDVEKYVLNIYFCLWWNWNQMTPNNILCERVINQLQMEPNCWSFTFTALIISIQLKEKVSWRVIWDSPSHQSLQMHPQRCRLEPAKELSVVHSSGERCWLSAGHLTGSWCRTSHRGCAGGREVQESIPALLPWVAVARWFSRIVSLPHPPSSQPSSARSTTNVIPVWFHVAVKVSGKISKWP